MTHQLWSALKQLSKSNNIKAQSNRTIELATELEHKANRTRKEDAILKFL